MTATGLCLGEWFSWLGWAWQWLSGAMGRAPSIDAVVVEVPGRGFWRCREA